MASHLNANPYGVVANGHLRIHKNVASSALGNERDVVVALPDGYHDEPWRRYPVIYLHDGQNLFDPATSFAGQIWAVDTTAAALAASGISEPVIVVGVYNTGATRADEYTAIADARTLKGAKVDLYGRFLVEELKPIVDAAYRTDPSAEATGLGGSSLGGLATLYIGLRHPDVFSRLACLSPAVWWGNGHVVEFVRSLPFKPETRIWLDTGTREGRGQVVRTRVLRDALVAKGWSLGEDLAYFEALNARHTERAWARRVDQFLAFLYPARAPRIDEAAMTEDQLRN